MKVEINVPEVVSLFKEIQKQPEKLFEMIRMDIRETVGQYLSNLMDMELTHFLGRRRYERTGEEDPNHRNGSYDRDFTLKGIGPVEVEVPRDRKGKFKTRIIVRSQRYEEDLRQDLCLMFLTGVSTRSLSMISSRLLGRKLSPTEVSSANRELVDAVEKWRTRDLSKESIKYLFIDGVCFSMRVDGSVEMVSVLVVIGVTEKGEKLVLALQAGDSDGVGSASGGKESASNWRELFSDLKRRGLDGQRVVLGVMDGLSGLEKVFREEFPRAKVQRCQVHVARNVLAKVPRKLKQAVADDLRSIFYASTKEKAVGFFSQFKERWEKGLPSAVKCLENSLDACLTFFSAKSGSDYVGNFPEEEWISLRTTNIIERLNKEFKRRTKPILPAAGRGDYCWRAGLL